MIKWSYWGPLGLFERGEMPRKDMQKNLQWFELCAREMLEETGADHVVYGRKLFGIDGELKEIRFYMEPMGEEEFDRVSRIQNHQVYAIHKL